MKLTLAQTVLLSLVANVGPAADHPAPRPGESPKALSKEAREELSGLLLQVAPRAKARFARAAMTIEEARHFADVDPKMSWQAEFRGWFVFGRRGLNDAPDVWSGIVFVQKGTNLMGYYRESW